MSSMRLADRSSSAGIVDLRVTGGVSKSSVLAGEITMSINQYPNSKGPAELLFHPN
jgi:hypothetical protein